MRNRIDELAACSDEEVREWLAARRARWSIAIDNTGVDGNVGAIVRGHNAFAGGGLVVCGRRRWHRGVSMGTYQYEPIEYGDPTRRPLMSVEADVGLPPCDDWLRQDACYLLGHDRWGVSPDRAGIASARLGPPRGWGSSTGPGVLAHVLMHRLRAGVDSTIPLPPPAPETPLWRTGWQSMPPAEQRALFDPGWWTREPWEDRLDWWLWLPRPQYPINVLLSYRLAHSIGARGVIVPPERAAPAAARPVPVDERRLRTMTAEEVVAVARAEDYPIVGLERGGSSVDTVMPARGVLQLGHERDGLELTDVCDDVASVPQWGSGRSLNVSMAAAVALDAAILRSPPE